MTTHAEVAVAGDPFGRYAAVTCSCGRTFVGGHVRIARDQLTAHAVDNALSAPSQEDEIGSNQQVQS